MGVGLEDEATIYWDYFYNYTTGPAMIAFAPLVVHGRLVKWNERIGRAQTGVLKWLVIDGYDEVFFCPGQRGHGPGVLIQAEYEAALRFVSASPFLCVQGNQRGDGERFGRRKNGRGGEGRECEIEREEGIRWDIERKELIAEEYENERDYEDE